MNKYELNLRKSPDQLEEEQIGFKAREAKQQIEGDILETEKSLSKARIELSQAESSYPFNSEKVVKAELKIEGFEAGLKRLEAIKKRLFEETEQKQEAAS